MLSALLSSNSVIFLSFNPLIFIFLSHFLILCRDFSSPNQSEDSVFHFPHAMSGRQPSPYILKSVWRPLTTHLVARLAAWALASVWKYLCLLSVTGRAVNDVKKNRLGKKTKTFLHLISFRKRFCLEHLYLIVQVIF